MRSDIKDEMALLQKEEYWLLQSVKFLLAHFPGSKHHFHVLLLLSHPCNHWVLRFTGFVSRQNCQAVFFSLFPSTLHPTHICVFYRPGPAEMTPLSHTLERSGFEPSCWKPPHWYCGAASTSAKKRYNLLGTHYFTQWVHPSNSHLDFLTEQFCSISIYYTFNCLLIGAAVFSMFEAYFHYLP